MNDDLDRRLNPFRYDSAGRLTPAALRQEGAAGRGAGGPGAGGDRVPPAADGGPGGVLRVEPSVLREHARDAEAVAGRFGEQCLAPLRSTAAAGGGLHGFRSAGALPVLEQRWRAEVRHAGELLGTFARDLRDGARHFEAADTGGARTFG